MHLWRLCDQRYAETPFDGQGSLYAPGRWNHQGFRVSYAASCVSLAVLQILASASRASLVSRQYVLVEAVLDDGAVRLIGQEELPDAWDHYPHPVATRELAVIEFANSAKVALSVPSALVAVDRTLVLKSDRIEPGGLRILNRQPFNFDRRVLS